MRVRGSLLLITLIAGLCLLLAAAPALAGDPFDGNPPGSQWGGHDINGKMYVVGVGEDGSVVCLLVTNDPRTNGTVTLWWDAEEEVDGRLHLYGHFLMTNEEGSWAGGFTSIHSTLGAKPYQNTTFATGVGSGAYEGYGLTLTKHTAWGMSPIIVKGSIEPIG